MPALLPVPGAPRGVTKGRRGRTEARVQNGHAGSVESAKGFTLVELMIALVVAVLLIVIAVPSFRSITLSSRLTMAANELVGALNAARTEAIKRNAVVQVCSNASSENGTDALGTACGSQTGAVYLSINGVATQISAGTPTLVDPLLLDGDMVALRFNADGQARSVGSSSPYTGTIADICTSALSNNNHRVIQMNAGSIISITTSLGACP